MCVGDELARMMLFHFAGRILQKFKISLPTDVVADLDGECGITLVPKSHRLLFELRWIHCEVTSILFHNSNGSITCYVSNMYELLSTHFVYCIGTCNSNINQLLDIVESIPSPKYVMWCCFVMNHPVYRKANHLVKLVLKPIDRIPIL